MITGKVCNEYSANMAIRSEPMLHSRFLETNSSKSKINKIAFEYECKLISITDSNKYNKMWRYCNHFIRAFFIGTEGLAGEKAPTHLFAKIK